MKAVLPILMAVLSANLVAASAHAANPNQTPALS